MFLNFIFIPIRYLQGVYLLLLFLKIILKKKINFRKKEKNEKLKFLNFKQKLNLRHYKYFLIQK